MLQHAGRKKQIKKIIRRANASIKFLNEAAAMEAAIVFTMEVVSSFTSFITY